MQKDKTIIGIDPGTNVLGYAIIEIINKDIKLHSLGIIQLQKYNDPYVKLKKIFEKIQFLIQTHSPDEMAIEAPFFGKNVQSMLKLGRAQGVAIAAAAVNDLLVAEYAPRKIKQSITGNGNASKEQVSAMLQSQLGLHTMPKYFDATDALGVALCHHIQSSSPFFSFNKSKKGNKWKNFIDDNPDRIKKR